MQGRTAREVDRERCCWPGNVRQPWLRMLGVPERERALSQAAELCVAAVEAAVASLVIVVFVALVVVVVVVAAAVVGVVVMVTVAV